MFGRCICIEKLEISPKPTKFMKQDFPGQFFRFLIYLPFLMWVEKIYLFKYIKLNISLPFVFKFYLFLFCGICLLFTYFEFLWCINIVLINSKSLKGDPTFKCFQDNIFEQSKYFHYGRHQYNSLIIW